MINSPFCLRYFNLKIKKGRTWIGKLILSIAIAIEIPFLSKYKGLLGMPEVPNIPYHGGILVNRPAKRSKICREAMTSYLYDIIKSGVKNPNIF